MSSDQKPGRIKIIAGSSAARTAVVRAGAGNVPAAAAGEAAKAGPASGGSMIFGAILFLIGCAIGGAALVAWPHLAG